MLFGKIVRGQSYTKGIGFYPGDTKENFAPTLKPDLQHYRNFIFLDCGIKPGDQFKT